MATGGRSQPGNSSAILFICSTPSPGTLGPAAFHAGGSTLGRAVHDQAPRHLRLPREASEAELTAWQSSAVRSAPDKAGARPKERCEGRQQRKSKGEREECAGARAGRKLAMVASRQEDYDPAGKDGWEAVECYMTRWLLSTSTSLASFVRSFVGNGGREYQGMAADLWPAAAPYPELFKKKQGAAALSRFAWLSEAQWKMVRRVEEHVADVLRVGVVGACETGRGAAKVESLEELISVLELQAREIVEDGYISQKSGVASNASGTSLAAGEVIGRMVGAQPVVAKAIETERLSFPSAPPFFDPTPLLPKRHREVFCDPVSLAEPVDPAVDRPPKVRVHASRAQVKELVKRLDASGRILLAIDLKRSVNHISAVHLL